MTSLQPIVKVLTRPLTLKSQQPLNGTSQQQMSGARSAGNRGCSAVEEDNNNNIESEVNELHHKKPWEKACTFCNEDLPGLLHTALPFGDILIPCWFFYFLALDSPWKLANPIYPVYIQKLWDQTFPKFKCVIALQNEPIFALVSLLFLSWCVFMLCGD